MCRALWIYYFSSLYKLTCKIYGFIYSSKLLNNPRCNYQPEHNLSRNSVVSEIFHLLPNSPNGRIHVQNVVYRATVYRTGRADKRGKEFGFWLLLLGCIYPLLSPFWQKLYKRRENANAECVRRNSKSSKNIFL